MRSLAAVAVLAVLVAALKRLESTPAGRRVFRWLPVPFWCYALPLTAVSLGWLPARDPAYAVITAFLLPIALILLLINLDLRAVIRAGRTALLAVAVGVCGVVAGAVAGLALLRVWLPPEAWRGAGALAGTWTGGTMNLLSLRSVLQTPEEMFAPLILVDALCTYSWMVVLVALSSHQRVMDRWLRADSREEPVAVAAAGPSAPRWSMAASLGLALAMTWISVQCARRLPTTLLVSSTMGWTVLLCTTLALLASLSRRVRHLAGHADRLGMPLLLLVLAATGAQASWDALRQAPAWLALGGCVLGVHAVVLLAAGRWLRLPLKVLAVASQANIGGVVSTPLVGSIYDRSLAPVGLLLAMACNAMGTYIGWLAAWLMRHLPGA